MSRTGAIEIAWNGGTHRFRLAIGELVQLQEKCDAGPAELIARLGSGRWRVHDVRETIRLGLVGGGLKPVEANALVAVNVDGRPLGENVQVAYAIVLAAVIGVEDEPAGK